MSGDLGVALPCSRPMAANEVENSNEPQEATNLVSRQEERKRRSRVTNLSARVKLGLM